MSELEPKHWDESIVSICPADNWYAIFKIYDAYHAKRLAVWAACPGSSSPIHGIVADDMISAVYEEDEFVQYLHKDELAEWRSQDNKPLTPFPR
ncbi:MAG: hypothetical protein BGO01_20465 [Armatimonadetes bacterium 55-13]|nr:hypothetical protein [Armatimonadota bacterium]ODU51399.1 MAG: hypothetical protein ABT09_03945 [bacterium SCN 57-13]OJU64485.1 MAG: hypothetical protein BGO01_20465 [Armatimonadetes bacterium 55-13]